MNFGEKIINYYTTLKTPKHLPEGVELLYPFKSSQVVSFIEQFYHTFYSDTKERIFLIGINPGRLGGGSTGIPFTDPVRLEQDLGIVNDLPKKSELSSRFVYEMIHALHGPKDFYKRFYITSVCPLGFVKEGKNLNYYDIKELQDGLEVYMIEELKKQIDFGAAPKAFSLGMGKNIAYLNKINEVHHLFESIEPLPHPRWIMQYRLKRKQEFIDLYREKLLNSQ